MNAANQRQWADFWQRIGASGDAKVPWARLREAYSESWRAYHNLTHIGHCLWEFDQAKQLAQNAESLEAAIWFHDFVYDTHAKDNEERKLRHGRPIQQVTLFVNLFGL
jgi:predicted metal-dependent HD superfamily phosphohydrolase